MWNASLCEMRQCSHSPRSLVFVASCCYTQYASHGPTTCLFLFPAFPAFQTVGTCLTAASKFLGYHAGLDISFHLSAIARPFPTLVLNLSLALFPSPSKPLRSPSRPPFSAHPLPLALSPSHTTFHSPSSTCNQSARHTPLLTSH